MEKGLQWIFISALVLVTLINIGLVTSDEELLCAKCNAYCNSKNQLIRGFTCNSTHPVCCGMRNSRYCCDNESLAVDSKYEYDVCICPSQSCSSMGWQALMSVIGLVISAVLIAVLCCNILKLCKWDSRRVRLSGQRSSRVSSGDLPTVSEEVSQPRRTRDPFTPQHVVLEPPSYDVICKDLPKYEDIVLDSNGGAPGGAEHEGHVNQAYSSDGLISRDNNALGPPNTTPLDSPPPYQSTA